ncbi:MAG TPA: PEP/pyruvate-binding domain-containing protein [Acidimicrobiia bacterium]|jgi:pyruvate,water dikinase|nr:PEP/pyruvate-binding domain-containing protein [Acidimicrobiia bacterium]
MGSHYVIPLNGAGCDSTAVGGKAAGLDRLASHGFPIPTSHAVTIAAYERAIAGAGLGEWLAELVAAPVPEPGDLAEAAALVEERFATTPMPADVEEEIVAVVRPLLERGRLAVRSSASAEDLGVASFAGQYRTFIGVDSVIDVLTAVRGCWASLWLPAVRAYRRRNRIPEEGLGMAVVLQVMVEADWSGVGFTIDPERRSAGMRIEVVPGLGEALVSGRLTPSDYTVDRETLEIQVTGDAEPPDFLEDLARMLLHVEDRLDAPQDVEWSTANGSITLLQARPITVVGPTTAEDDGFDGPVGTRDTFTPRGVVEMLPDVVPPLLWTINGPMIEDAFRKVIDSLGAAGGAPDRQFVGRFRGRAALDLSLLQEIAGELPGGSATEVERQFLGRVVSDTTEDADRTVTRRGRVSGALRTRRAQRHVTDEVAIGAAAVSGILALETDLSVMPVRGLLAYRRSLRDLAWRLVAAEVAASSAAAAAYRALELLLQRWLSEEDAASWAQRLTAGTIGDVAAGLGATRRLDAAYRAAVAEHPGLRWALEARPVERAPERIRQLGPAGRRFLAEVQWIVRSQGSQAVYGGRTWAEDGGWAWEQLAMAVARSRRESRPLTAEPLADLMEHLGNGRRWRMWRILTGQLVDLRLRWLARQVDEATRWLGLRERAKSALLMLGGEERRIIIEGAQRLEASRQIATAGHVELLSDAEFASMLVGATPPSDAEMARRRTVLEACRAAPRLPEFFVGAPGAEPSAVEAGDTLVGWAASPGIVEGRVKIVETLAEGVKLERGDVLVARATDPSWTPLLLVASALVLEEGGPLSHGAIVAREFGLPAVLNVPGVARALVDGEIVQVDGYAGTVRRLEYVEAA